MAEISILKRERRSLITYRGVVNVRQVVEPDHKISTSGDPDRYYKGG